MSLFDLTVVLVLLVGVAALSGRVLLVKILNELRQILNEVRPTGCLIGCSD